MFFHLYIKELFQKHIYQKKKKNHKKFDFINKFFKSQTTLFVINKKAVNASIA